MLEVYNEAVKDLLVVDADGPGASLEVRVGKGARGAPTVYVEGLVECEVRSLEEVEQLIEMGVTNRHVGSNNFNEHSSRSHLVFTVKIVAVNRTTGATTNGKLNLIDLAGSERLKSTNASGTRLKEAQNINKSLSSLGDVVAALGQPGKGHVPYRNSKLTFLLQDSLTANARSTCSLTFAGRCRAVQLGKAKKSGSSGKGKKKSSSPGSGSASEW
mmetsp:Transcript_12391/g.33681  ORF Transcript_12391/g.33681 Transcript_12391/m.33681 type:complete len:215 (-) Transcript_12391:151-795(-)